MKIKVVLMTFAVLTAMSCTNDSDVSYSCDQMADLWVKNNLQEIHSLDRMAWLDLPQTLQIPVYRAFSQEQRISFWKDKLSEVLKLDWSQEEKNHILKVVDFIEMHPTFFCDGKLTDEQKDEADLFLYRWVTDADEQLGWDDMICYAITCTGIPIKSKNGVIDMDYYLRESVEMLTESWEYEPVRECDCNQGSMFSCTIIPIGAVAECKDTDCDEHKGCGFLWQFDCNGKCAYVP